MCNADFFTNKTKLICFCRSNLEAQNEKVYFFTTFSHFIILIMQAINATHFIIYTSLKQGTNEFFNPWGFTPDIF